jgi:hypothetical protein
MDPKNEAAPPQIFSEVIRYRDLDFILTGFSFGWCAYPQNFPHYENRSIDLDTLWLAHDQGKFIINWHPIPQTLEACEAAVVAWTDMTFEYIKTGETIHSQFQRRFYGGQNGET